MPKSGFGVKAIQSVSRLQTSGFSRGGAVIRSHIGSTRDCGGILKLERFSNLSGRSFRCFGLGSPIGLRYISLVFSLRANT